MHTDTEDSVDELEEDGLCLPLERCFACKWDAGDGNGGCLVV